MQSRLILDHHTFTALVRRVLPSGGMVGGLTIAPADGAIRLNLERVNTGMSVFGMAVPPVDAELAITGIWQDGALLLQWSITDLKGVPPMTAKLLGKPAIARLIADALGTTWGFNVALRVEDSGDFRLTLDRLRIPGTTGLQFTAAAIPSPDGAAALVDFLIPTSC